MTLNTIKEKLHQYLENGDPKKVKAFYAMVEDEIEDGETWKEDFIKELDKRTYEMENGMVKTYTLDEMVNGARSKTKIKLKHGAKDSSKGK